MNDMTPDREERKSSLKGMGSSRKRVEMRASPKAKAIMSMTSNLMGCCREILYAHPMRMPGWWI